MPPLVVAQAGLLRLVWTLQGVPYAVNVMGVHDAGGTGITQAAVNALGAAIKTAVATSTLDDFLSDAVALQSVGLRNINVPNQAELIDNGAPVVGTETSNTLPPQVALCVTLRTALAGRSFRGRVYLCGFTEGGNNTFGTATSGLGVAALAFVNAIIAACSAQSLPLAIVSRPDANAIPPRTGFVTNVTSAVVRDLVWDTQRRRAVPGI